MKQVLRSAWPLSLGRDVHARWDGKRSRSARREWADPAALPRAQRSSVHSLNRGHLRSVGVGTDALVGHGGSPIPKGLMGVIDSGFYNPGVKTKMFRAPSITLTPQRSGDSVGRSRMFMIPDSPSGAPFRRCMGTRVALTQPSRRSATLPEVPVFDDELCRFEGPIFPADCWVSCDRAS